MGMREKLIELVRNMRSKITVWHTSEEIADMLIASGVAIPVRCKDCKRSREFSAERCECSLDGELWALDDFCSYGERRTDDST